MNELDREIARRARGRRHAQAVGIIVPQIEEPEVFIFNRDHATGEYLRYSRATHVWQELRDDAKWHVVPEPESGTFVVVDQAEVEQYTLDLQYLLQLQEQTS